MSVVTLREWQVVLANASRAALQEADPEGLVRAWRPTAEPYWPATIKPPCAIVAPGGAGGAWIEPDEELTLCGIVPAYFSIVAVSGTPSRPAEEILPMMVEAIYAHLAPAVMADPKSSVLWGAPRVGTVGAPQEIPGAVVANAPTFLGAPIEIVLNIPQPSPTPG